MNFSGAPERIRTSDPRIRNPMLYPAELPGRGKIITLIFLGLIWYLLSMSKDVHLHLIEVSKKHCKPLQKLLQNNGVLEINVPKNLPLFDCLAQTVIEQQLAYAAAETIWKRLNKAATSANQTLFLFCNQNNRATLKKIGLSGNKIKAILGARSAIENGDLNAENLSVMNYEKLHQTITSLWGFGNWSVDMIAIFYYGMTNIWSAQDLILNRGIKSLCEKSDLSPESLLELVDPYQSYLALHIWRSKDAKFD